MLKTTFRAAAIGTFLAFAAAPALATENYIVEGYAVSGYDPVSYFVAGAPVKGDPDLSTTYAGATYLFASPENKAAFEADPAKYAPQYGGFCAFGLAMGRKVPGDPNVWAIEDGKLYLNINPDVQTRWQANVPGFVRGADNNWQIVRSIPDSVLETTPPEGVTLGAQ